MAPSQEEPDGVDQGAFFFGVVSEVLAWPLLRRRRLQRERGRGWPWPTSLTAGVRGSFEDPNKQNLHDTVLVSPGSRAEPPLAIAAFRATVL